ncbi:hypothetical protein [Nocardia mangyaensis]|nr:hypothetical protein [Nocardia mangyaensis]
MSGAKTPNQRILTILFTGALGLCLASATLFFASQPINVLAYWLGYGEPIQVEVTKGTPGSSIGRGGPGEGRVVPDGTQVWLYTVNTGETVTARPRLINIGARPHVYHSPLRAAEDLVLIIPTGLFGVPLVALILATIAPDRVRAFTERAKARNERRRRSGMHP